MINGIFVFSLCFYHLLLEANSESCFLQYDLIYCTHCGEWCPFAAENINSSLIKTELNEP